MSANQQQSNPPTGATEHSLAPSAGYPLRTLDEMAQWLIAARLVDEEAYYDAEGYDGGVTLHHLEVAYMKATCRDNAKLRDAGESGVEQH